MNRVLASPGADVSGIAVRDDIRRTEKNVLAGFGIFLKFIRMSAGLFDVVGRRRQERAV
jgi:hypothetical protein